MSETDSSGYMDSDKEEEEVGSSQEASDAGGKQAEEPWRAFMRAFPSTDLVFHIPGAYD